MISRFAYYREMLIKIPSLPAIPKFINYLKFRSLPRRATMKVKRYTPQIGSIWVTLRCNLSCGHCAASKILQTQEQDWRASEVDLVKLKRIMDHPLYHDCLLVDLEGGEPLLVNDLDRSVAYLRQNGHLINTTTNGVLLLQRIQDLKDAGISRISVSCYEENRTLLERDLEKINAVFPVHASMILFKSQVLRNPQRLLETARFIKDAGCLSLRFWMYRPMGVDPKPEEIIADDDQAFIEFRRRMEAALPGFCLWPRPLQTPPMKKRCPQLWQRINCDGLGNMGICCGSDTNLQGPNSNLFSAGPDVVFNHPTLVKMRTQLLDPKSEPPQLCKTCNLLGDPGW